MQADNIPYSVSALVHYTTYPQSVVILFGVSLAVWQ